MLDAGETTTTTGAGGNFSFTGLAPGHYRVRDILPSGWRRQTPASGYFDISVAPGQTIAGRNFAETTKAVISGVIFKDTNGNGKKDSGEIGLSGWTVFLDANNNGKLDAGEISFVTGADGKFSFVVVAGKYHLREVLKRGFVRIRPSASGYALTLGSGQTNSGKNFANNRSRL